MTPYLGKQVLTSLSRPQGTRTTPRGCLWMTCGRHGVLTCTGAGGPGFWAALVERFIMLSGRAGGQGDSKEGATVGGGLGL